MFRVGELVVGVRKTSTIFGVRTVLWVEGDHTTTGKKPKHLLVYMKSHQLGAWRIQKKEIVANGEHVNLRYGRRNF